MLPAAIGGFVLVAGVTILLVSRRSRRTWYVSEVSQQWLAEHIAERLPD